MTSNQSSFEALQEIRQMMDRSSRFLSLSGWNGISAGIFALAGSFLAYRLIGDHRATMERVEFDIHSYMHLILNLTLLALAVLGATIAVAVYFTHRRTKLDGVKMWTPASKRMLTSLFIPIVVGGLFIAAMIYSGVWQFIAGSSLIFYGLGLISASKYTLTDMRYVGFVEIIIGLVCLFFPQHQLYFWAFGFGVVHLVYGIVMFIKYDEKPVANQQTQSKL